MSASTSDEYARFNHMVKEISKSKKRKPKFKKLNKKISRIIPSRILSIFSKPQEDKLRKILNAFSAVHQNVRFIQIGSKDGVMGDPIHEYIMRCGWSGVVFEPDAYVELTK